MKKPLWPAVLFFSFPIFCFTAQASGKICLKGAIHVHSHRSFDSPGTFEDIARAAELAGLDFLILTEHPALHSAAPWQPPPSEGPLIWIDGAEVELENQHQVLVLGPAAGAVRWEKGKELEGLRQAKGLGATIFLAHLAWSPQFPYPELLHGVEIINPHISPIRMVPFLPKRLFLALTGNIEGLWRDMAVPYTKEMEIWNRLAQSKNLGIMAGNDSHQNLRLLGRQIDPYEVSLKFVSTYVWADRKSEQAILEGLQLGQSYAAFTILAQARGFRFESSNNALKVFSPESGIIKIFRNGEPLAETSGASAVIKIPGPGFYRAEVWKQITNQKKPWIYSNIIKVPNK